MTDLIRQKQDQLKECLHSMGSVLVAFSSGVDSTFLLKMAHEVLGDHAVAVTARSGIFPSREYEQACAFCKKEGIRHIILDTDPLSVEGFRENPPDRCYHCKRAIFQSFSRIAGEQGLSCVAEGSNVDDMGDYRPGMRAVKELKIRSPLRESGLTKQEIRTLSREMGLSTWDKPSCACLASRISYHEEITGEKLKMTDLAEQKLMEYGFTQVRVRMQGRSARIELPKEDLDTFFRPDIRSSVTAYLHELGYLYVSLDLDGFQSGSMNRVLQ